MNPLDVLGTLRLEDGRLWVEAAHDFQIEDVRAVLDGPEPLNFLTRSRGGAKTTDQGAVAVSVMASAADRLRGYWLAADADQGRLAIDCIQGFVARTPALAGRLEVQSHRVIVPTTGATLEVLPADAPGAWGLTPHWVFVDELANWNDGAAARRLWEAASSAVAKRADARMVVLTTAGSPDHFAYKVLEHARTSPLWRVSERLGPAPWLDPDRLEEQRQRLPDAVFRQLFMNEWTQAAGSFLDPAMVEAAFRLDGPTLDRAPGCAHVAGLDLGTVNDRTVLSIGHRAGDEVVLDRMLTWQGSRRRPVDFSEVEEAIVQAHRRYRFGLKLDPWQGLDLAQRLRARGVRADEYTFTAASKQRLAASLLSTINSGNLAMYEAEGLRDELLALRLVQTSSGAWAFDHKSGGHDDRAVALGLMAVALLERSGGPGSLSVPRGEIPGVGDGKSIARPRPSMGQVLAERNVDTSGTRLPAGVPAWQRRALRRQQRGGGSWK